MVQNRGKFEYPLAFYDLSSSDTGKTFNQSGSYFEYNVYVVPDMYSSGSYRISVELEDIYVPPAFEPVTPSTNTTN